MQEVVKSLGNVPLYPKAKLDMQMTKVIQGTAAVTSMFTGKQSFAAGVFRVPVTPQIAVSWYDAELAKLGYVPTKARQPSVGQKMENQIMHQYFKKKGNEIIMVQAGVVPEERRADPDAATMLIVMRITGVSSASGGTGKVAAPEVPDLPAEK